MTEKTAASAPHAPSSKRLEPLRQVDADVLSIAYYEAGPVDGPVVMLMHGFPYASTAMSTSRRNWRPKAAALSFPICAATARPGFASPRRRARASRRRSAPT